MRYLSHAGIILIAAIVLVVLMISEHGKRDVLRDQLSQAGTQIQTAENSLKRTVAENSGMKALLSENSRERDSLRALWEESERRLVDLNMTIRTMDKQIAFTRDSLTNERRTLDSVKVALATYTAEQRSRFTVLESQLEGLMQGRDSLSAILEGVYPWYSYYRQEAGRTWAKKLFGAGRGHRPGAPDPWQETERTQELQANALGPLQSQPGGTR